MRDEPHEFQPEWVDRTGRPLGHHASAAACHAGCSCGWRGESLWQSAGTNYLKAREEWHREHWEPLVRPDPRQVLVPGPGARSEVLLDGRAVEDLEAL
jgi:hypothetical protein